MQVIRRLLTVVIWVPALFFAIAGFVIAPQADGDGGPWGVVAMSVGILVLAFVANIVTNWIFAD